MSDQVLDDLVRGVIGKYLGEKIKRQNILNQNGANLVYLHGQDIGRKLGLPEDVLDNVTPFPAQQTVVVQQEATESGKQEDDKSGSKTTDPKSKEDKKKEGDSEDQKSKPLKSLVSRILPYILTGALTLGAGAGLTSLIPDKQEEEKPPVVAPVEPGDELNPEVGIKIRG
jgi:hypothetical protein